MSEAAAEAQQGGTTTTLPLSDIARKGLQKRIRSGRICLLIAILLTGGIITGIAASGAVFIIFLPLAGFLGWMYYMNSFMGVRDLRDGTMVRYTGTWRERTRIKQTRSGAVYRLYVQPPNLTQPVLFRKSALARSARQAGTGDEWTSSGGQLEYTNCCHQPLTYSRHASPH